MKQCKVDGRGRSCPEPVLMTKKALQDNPEGLEVLVDNLTAKENIMRFAKNSGYHVEVSENGSNYILNIQK